MSQFSFRRPELAKSFCDALSGAGIMDARSGLFLAARRRVGKSTFLREDLVPEMESRGWITLYIDLWIDRAADPATLIADAIKSKLAAFDKPVWKAARAMRLAKVTVGGSLTIDLTKPGLPEGLSLADALEMLQQKAGKPIGLIVDEAQHALTTENGSTAMFSLKAARDHLNKSNTEPKLILVMTGSNRDKLAQLVLNKSQPFFGSRVTPFPLLNKDFTEAYTDWVNRSLAKNNKLDPPDVFEAFRLVGHRPELLRAIIGDVALQGEAPRLSELLRQNAQDWHEKIWGEYESAYKSLTPLQKAIIDIMAHKGGNFSPFTEDSMGIYRRALGERELSTSTIQTALDSLRERELVWREARGAYALEDDGFADWILHIKIQNS